MKPVPVIHRYVLWAGSLNRRSAQITVRAKSIRRSCQHQWRARVVAGPMGRRWPNVCRKCGQLSR